MTRIPLSVAVGIAVVSAAIGARAAPDGMADVFRAIEAGGIRLVRAPDGTAQFSVDTTTGELAAYFDGGTLAIEVRGILFQADRIALLIGPLPAEGEIRTIEAYAEGNVWVKAQGGALGEGFLRADAIAFDGRTLAGQAVNVWGVARVETRAILQFRAKALHFRAAHARLEEKAPRFRFEELLAEEVVVSNCDFAAPHWGVRARSAEIEGQPEPATDVWVRMPSGWVEVGGEDVLPLPGLRWNTQWLRRFPLRRASYSKSGKFGHLASTLWDLSFIPGIGEGLDFLDRELSAPTDLLGRLDYMSARGIGYGASAESGRKPYKWDPDLRHQRPHYVEFDAFAIRDRGEDRNDVIPETKNRGRIRLRYRHALEPLGVVDAELGRWSDADFLNEYFERELKADKPPETFISLRRNLGSDMAITLLQKNRVNDFESSLERAPEGRFYWIERPIVQPSWFEGSGLYGSTTVQAANLHYRPADEIDLPGARSGRFDGLGELGAPFGLGRYLRLRPRTDVRWTAWEHRRIYDGLGRVDAGGGGIDRFIASAGIDLSSEVSRIFQARSRFLGIGGLKHAFVPKLDYVNRFEVTRPPEDIYPFDAIDALDREESVGVGIRNYIFARPYDPESSVPTGPIRRYAEIDLGVRYYPRAGRDNPRPSDGKRENFSMVEGEILLDPHPQVGTQVEFEVDPNSGRGIDVLDAVLRLGSGEPFQVQFGERYLAREPRSGRERESYFHVMGSLKLSEKYRFDTFLQYDWERRRPIEEVFVLTRFFHRWALRLSVDIDEGEGSDVSLKVQFSPIELLPALMEEKDRYAYR
ncbi:MAG: hypothetical protein JXP34_28750 [Planctomycetes bacterium]|nr:hypothetical protein [Planctomycetota bacterium]